MPAGKNVSLKNGTNAINTSLDVVSDIEQHVLAAFMVARTTHQVCMVRQDIAVFS